jgi:hypothetical protein
MTAVYPVEQGKRFGNCEGDSDFSVVLRSAQVAEIQPFYIRRARAVQIVPRLICKASLLIYSMRRAIP